jgi:hypothetical protein
MVNPSGSQSSVLMADAGGFSERDMPQPVLASLDQTRVLIASSKPCGVGCRLG